MTTAPKPKRCKDCVTDGITTVRPLVGPGPRCLTHHRARRRVVKVANHARRIEATYGLTEQEYWAIYAAQGGRCYMCQFATGKTKRLAVDHEHSKPGCEHPPAHGCHKCVRALLCGPCNQAQGRLGVAAFRRAIEVRTDPPAQRVLLALDGPP